MKTAIAVLLLLSPVAMWGGPIASFEQISPTPTTYLQAVDFDSFTLSLSGTAIGEVQELGNLGCYPSDFVGFTPGRIAMVGRGICTFSLKGINAESAGAIGFIVVNNVAGFASGTYVAGSVPDIPGVLITQSLGSSLAQTEGLVVRIDIVPEPATWMLAAGGFALLVFRRRR